MLLCDVNKTPYRLYSSSKNRVFKYHKESDTILMRLCSFKKSITLCCANNAGEVLLASKDGSIVLYDLFTHATLFQKKYTKYYATQALFIEGEYFVFTTTDATLHICHSRTQKTVRLKSGFAFIKELYLSPCKNFLFLANYTAEVHFVSLTQKENPFLLKEKIYLQEGQTLKELYRQLPNEKLLEQLTREHEFALAFTSLKTNPTLRYTKSYERVQKEFFQALIFTLEHNLEEEFTMLCRLQEEQCLPFGKLKNLYEDFSFAVEQKKYFVAYNYCDNFPVLTQTLPYEKLRQAYEHHKEKAKELLKEGKKEAAKELLGAFYLVKSKQQEIKRVLASNDSLQQEQNSSHNQKEQILQKYYEADDFCRCYSTLDANPQLRKSSLGVMLQKHWKRVLQKAEKLAVEGNFAQLYEHFGALLFIDSRKELIGSLLRLSFYQKLKILFQQEEYLLIQKLLEHYIEIFGYDVEIDSFIEAFEDKSAQKMTLLHNYRDKSRHDWIYAAIFDHLR